MMASTYPLNLGQRQLRAAGRLAGLLAVCGCFSIGAAVGAKVDGLESPLGKAGLPGRRALIVENDAFSIRLLLDRLADLGCDSITVATTVPEAIEKLHTLPFDCATLAINLGGRSCEAVARLLVNKHTPFVIATDREAAPAVFPSAPLVKKPFMADELVSALSQFSLGTRPAPPALSNIRAGACETGGGRESPSLRRLGPMR